MVEGVAYKMPSFHSFDEDSADRTIALRLDLTFIPCPLLPGSWNKSSPFDPHFFLSLSPFLSLKKE